MVCVWGRCICLCRLVDVWSCCLSLQELIAGTLSDSCTVCVPCANLTGQRKEKASCATPLGGRPSFQGRESGKKGKDSLVSSSRAAINISGWRGRAQAFTVIPFLLWWTRKSLSLPPSPTLTHTRTNIYIHMHLHDGKIQHRATLMCWVFSKHMQHKARGNEAASVQPSGNV